jgi:translation initiation factor 2-alpha kinase 4
MERHIALSDLKQTGELPSDWVNIFPEQASLLRRLMSSSPSERPSAIELLQNDFPPRMEYELIDSILRTMCTSEDTSIHDKFMSAIFDEEMLSNKHNHEIVRKGASCIQYSDLDTEIRDQLVEITTQVFKQHCAKHIEIIPVRLVTDSPHLHSKEWCEIADKWRRYD